MPKIVPRLAALVLCLALSPLAAAQSDLEPGQWEMTVEFTVTGDPGFKQPPATVSRCFSAADARDTARVTSGLGNPGANDCTFSDKRESPGHLEFAVRCEGPTGVTGRGTVDYAPNSFLSVLNLNFNAGAAQPTGSVSRVSGRRLGSC